MDCFSQLTMCQKEDSVEVVQTVSVELLGKGGSRIAPSTAADFSGNLGGCVCLLVGVFAAGPMSCPWMLQSGAIQLHAAWMRGPQIGHTFCSIASQPTQIGHQCIGRTNVRRAARHKQQNKGPHHDVHCYESPWRYYRPTRPEHFALEEGKSEVGEVRGVRSIGTIHCNHEECFGWRGMDTKYSMKGTSNIFPLWEDPVVRWDICPTLVHLAARPVQNVVVAAPKKDAI